MVTTLLRRGGAVREVTELESDIDGFRSDDGVTKIDMNASWVVFHKLIFILYCAVDETLFILQCLL